MGKEKSIKLTLVLYFHCSCLFPHSPKMFPSKIKSSIMQEYVTGILAGSFFFPLSEIFRITHDLMQKTNN